MKIKGQRKSDIKVNSSRRNEKVKEMGKVGESITISWKIDKDKKDLKKRENVENGWLIWPLMWLNKNVVTINDTLQLLYINKYIIDQSF